MIVNECMYVCMYVIMNVDCIERIDETMLVVGM